MFTRSATQLTGYRTLVNTSQTTELRATAQGLDEAWMRNLPNTPHALQNLLQAASGCIGVKLGLLVFHV
jgi:hypothetical protein